MSIGGDKCSKVVPEDPMSVYRMSSNLRKQLRFYMDLREINAATVARKAQVPKQSLSGWLSGKKPADVGQVKRVADALGTTLDNLMFGDGKDREAEKVMELDALLGEGWITGLFEVRFRRVKK